MLLLSAVVCVWVAVAVLTWVDARHELDELLDGHLAQAAALLIVQQMHEIEEAEHDDHREHGGRHGSESRRGQEVQAPSLHRYAPKVAFQVFHEGRLVLHSANAPRAPMLAPHERVMNGFATVHINNANWRVFAAHGAERDIQVYVGEQVRSRMSILRAVLRSTLWPMLVALPLLGIAVWWAVSRSMTPLRRLGRLLAARQPQELEPVRLVGAPSEMVPLVDALNALFARIATLLESERRFTADAAHELRTPIAAIRAQAQVAQGEADDALRRQALEKTIEGCDRAARLVDQLLMLSRLEAYQWPTLQPVNLCALTRRVVAEVAPRSVAKQQVIDLHAAQSCTISGEETLLTVLVRNLLDNAVRYSPPAAHVRVSVRAEPTGTVLCIEDSGPGLSSSDQARLGQRFFRVPGTDESGSGLGWSIIRRIAAVHGLEVQTARSEQLGGLAVRIIRRA